MLPDILFRNATSHLIAPDSYLWLYCIVNSNMPTLEVTWTKNNADLPEDMPHIRYLNSTNSSSSAFILIVDNFNVSDDGTYQCTAEHNEVRVTGSSLTLTGMTVKHTVILI